MITTKHILSICFENAGVGSGLGENLAKHFQVEPQCIADTLSLGEGGGVDIHDHVDQSFHLGGPTGFSHKAEVNTQVI